MDVKLLFAKAVREASVGELDKLRVQYISVEAVRSLPIRDGDHAVIEPNRRVHPTILPWRTPSAGRELFTACGLSMMGTGDLQDR